MAEPNETTEAGEGPVGRIPIVEERAQIHRRTVETGRVRVRLRTEVEEVPVEAALRHEALEVERVAIGRELAPGETPPMPREEEDGAVLIVPVLEEVLVVETRLVLAEEVRIRRHVAVETAATTVALRRQRAEVERLPAEDLASNGGLAGAEGAGAAGASPLDEAAAWDGVPQGRTTDGEAPAGRTTVEGAPARAQPRT